MEKSDRNTSQVADTRILENITTMSGEISNLKTKCENFRKLLDEGTYKVDSLLNVINGLKIREQNVMSTDADPAVIQQMSQEQVDSFLELLKSPAFQSLARQFLTKFMAPQGNYPGEK